jgi:hypothetical protein
MFGDVWQGWPVRSSPLIHRPPSTIHRHTECEAALSAWALLLCSETGGRGGSVVPLKFDAVLSFRNLRLWLQEIEAG